MAIFNLGSINADIFYQVPHIPHEGETLATTARRLSLGGKGANQSVALLRAGARVRHIGALGQDTEGRWLLEQLTALGVGIDFIEILPLPSGHAVICVADNGENAITLFGGANKAISEAHIQRALQGIKKNDWLVMQNETKGQVKAAQQAKAAGAKVAYSAAPFVAKDVSTLLPHLDLIAVNEDEATALCKAMSVADPTELPVAAALVTKGASGACFYDNKRGETCLVAGKLVKAVDTTGAGDTFFGYFLASLDAGLPPHAALNRANSAGALMVTKRGTAEAIPTLAQVQEYIDKQ